MIGIPLLKAQVTVMPIVQVVPMDNGEYDVICTNGRLRLSRPNLIVDIPSVGNYVIIPDHRLGLPMFVLTEERYQLFIDQNLPT
jgi:hypothetical protein